MKTAPSSCRFFISFHLNTSLVVWEQLHGDCQHINTKGEGYLRVGVVSELAASINTSPEIHLDAIMVNVYNWQDLRQEACPLGQTQAPRT